MSDDTVRQTFRSTILDDHYERRTDADLKSLERQGFESRLEQFQRILDTDDEFFVLYHCTNIVACWLSMLSGGLVAEFAGKDDSEAARLDQVAALAFFSRLANDLWAIIELVERGFDLQARALTRSYLEHVDVLICCIRDERLTKEFVEAVEPEQANAFWHRYVSKNKAKKLVSSFISETLGKDDGDLVDTLREDADLFGSTLVHPTMAAGLAAAFGDGDTDYGDSYPIFPLPIAASVGIFRTILTHHLWLSFAMGAQPIVGDGAWRALFASDYLVHNQKLEKLWRAYRRMFTFLLDQQLLMRPRVEDNTIGEGSSFP
jgi:hypothetical protein